MKLNGALKPRQGASRQGSSPGVVLKKYRIKRYFKVNENVGKNRLLHERGEKPKTLIEKKIINRNSVCFNQRNQQQIEATSLSQKLDTKGTRGKTFSSGISSRSLGRINLPTLTKTEKQKYFPAFKKIKVCHVVLNNWENENRINQILASITEAKAEVVRAENYKTKTNIEIDFEQKAETVCNITTRQINNTKLHEKRAKRKRDNIKSDDRKSKLVESSVTLNNKNSITLKEVNKFLFVPNINESLISRLFIQLKLLLLSMFSHAIKPLNRNPLTHCIVGGGGIVDDCRLDCVSAGYYNLVKMMRAAQLLERICFKNARGLRPSVAFTLVIYAAIAVSFPQPAVGDDGDTFFPINGLETTTPEFDYASRGQKKFGDKCDNTLECGFPGSICDPKKKSCQCTEDLPVTNHIDKCGKEAAVNESCFFNEQCEVKYFQTECRDQRCVCRFDMTPVWLKDGSVECKGRGDKKGPETYIDPAMIGVLIGMALMFIIICVVLRLFSQARWRENRTIFNTPNPRLMNVSLLRESKLLHGQERRGSRMSVRAPSRQPSMASLRPHSPNPSLGKTGRMTRSKSNTRSSDSRVSDASNCSRLLEHHTATTTHLASHPHTYAISPHAIRSSTSHGPQPSISPISINSPTAIMTNVKETSADETTDGNTNLISSRSNSHGSNASATSIKSTRSNSVSPAGVAVAYNSHHERKGSTYQPHQHQQPHQQQQKIQPLHQQQEEQQDLTQTNIISNPVAETVTVEIIEPEK